MYHIQGLCPSRGLGGYGFNIQLWPQWRDMVAASGLDQEKVSAGIKSRGQQWLDVCGYDQIFDPDNCGAWKDPQR